VSTATEGSLGRLCAGTELSSLKDFTHVKTTDLSVSGSLVPI